MLGRLWQRSMSGLARSRALTRLAQDTRATARLAQRFVAGNTPEQAVARAETLHAAAIRASLHYLAEDVDDAEGIADTRLNNLRVATLLAGSGLDLHVSIGPIQLGWRTSPGLAEENARTLAERVKSSVGGQNGRHGLLFGMEDASLVDATLALHDTLKDRDLPVALTLQAYLRRTEADLRAQIERGSAVRLVKGAFVAGADIAFTRRHDIKSNFRELIAMMLSTEAKRRGVYPAIATHDTDLQEFARAEAATNGWKPGEYEIEMLLGVRSEVAAALARQGERVRLYLPFGTDWWPYALNRIGENPENALLLGRALLS